MPSLQAHLTSWIVKHRLKPRLHGADVSRIRVLMTPRPSALPGSVTVQSATIGNVQGEWLRPAGPTSGTLLYLHGGAYVACSAETHRPITAAFAAHGLAVFAPDYRLAPENPYPAAVDDALAVYRALLDSGIKPENLAVSGDSAGGGLALALLLAARDAGLPLPAGAVLFSPWTDLAGTGPSIQSNDRNCAMFFGADIVLAARHYVPNGDVKTPYASPLYADLSSLPPMLIHVGKNEVLLDDSVRLMERATAAGVRTEIKIWPVVPHVWQIVPALPEAKASIRESALFLRTLMGVR